MWGLQAPGLGGNPRSPEGKFHSVWSMFPSSYFCRGRTVLADVPAGDGRGTF